MKVKRGMIQPLRAVASGRGMVVVVVALSA